MSAAKKLPKSIPRKEIAEAARNGLVDVALGGKNDLGSAVVSFFDEAMESWTPGKGHTLIPSNGVRAASIVSLSKGIGKSVDENIQVFVEAYLQGLKDAIDDLESMGVRPAWIRGLANHLPHHARQYGLGTEN